MAPGLVLVERMVYPVLWAKDNKLQPVSRLSCNSGNR
jgi:hypothetical protein